MALGHTKCQSYLKFTHLVARSPAMVMKIGHPSDQPLSEEQKLVLLAFKKRLETMVSSQGLTAANVHELVNELRTHPLISTQLMQEIRQELSRLMPGKQFTFD